MYKYQVLTRCCFNIEDFFSYKYSSYLNFQSHTIETFKVDLKIKNYFLKNKNVGHIVLYNFFICLKKSLWKPPPLQVSYLYLSSKPIENFVFFTTSTFTNPLVTSLWYYYFSLVSACFNNTIPDSESVM